MRVFVEKARVFARTLSDGKFDGPTRPIDKTAGLLMKRQPGR